MPDRAREQFGLRNPLQAQSQGQVKPEQPGEVGQGETEFERNLNGILAHRTDPDIKRLLEEREILLRQPEKIHDDGRRLGEIEGNIVAAYERAIRERSRSPE